MVQFENKWFIAIFFLHTVVTRLPDANLNLDDDEDDLSREINLMNSTPLSTALSSDRKRERGNSPSCDSSSYSTPSKRKQAESK